MEDVCCAAYWFGICGEGAGVAQPPSQIFFLARCGPAKPPVPVPTAQVLSVRNGTYRRFMRTIIHIENHMQIALEGKQRSMHPAQRIQSEQYSILRSRLQRKSQPTCGACHAPLRPATPICPRCGANRANPMTGVTQRLPRIAAPWFRRDVRLILGVCSVLFQAGVWLLIGLLIYWIIRTLMA